MKKIAVLLGVLLALLVVGYVAANWFLGKALTEGLAVAKTMAEERGLVVSRLTHGGARILSFRSVGVRDLTFDARRKGADPAAGGSIALHVDQLRVTLRDTETRSIELNATGMTLNESGEANARFSGQFQTTLRAEPERGKLQPGPAAQQLISALREMRKTSQTGAALRFTGSVAFTAGGGTHEAAVYTETIDERSIVRIPTKDLTRISRAMDPKNPLRPAEAELLSRRALQAPTMLRIRDRAQNVSRAAAADDEQVPEDAYRHVLWSYLLTHAFGPELAQQITDAHETGATGNTAREKAMDLRNNEVGRRYALSRVAEDALLERVRTDPQVIRSAEAPAFQ